MHDLKQCMNCRNISMPETIKTHESVFITTDIRKTSLPVTLDDQEKVGDILRVLTSLAPEENYFKH